MDYYFNFSQSVATNANGITPNQAVKAGHRLEARGEIIHFPPVSVESDKAFVDFAKNVWVSYESFFDWSQSAPID